MLIFTIDKVFYYIKIFRLVFIELFSIFNFSIEYNFRNVFDISYSNILDITKTITNILILFNNIIFSEFLFLNNKKTFFFYNLYISVYYSEYIEI